MKRFRISLRLLFLIVALVSVVLAWQKARNELKRHERDYERFRIEERLLVLQWRRRDGLQNANTFNRPLQIIHLSGVRKTENEIAAVQKELDNFDQ